MKTIIRYCLLMAIFLIVLLQAGQAQKSMTLKHYLYVATPGIRDYLGYGGHGILVFDIDHQHRFVKRIATKGLHANGRPSNVKGIAASVPLNSVFISTLESLQRIDLSTNKIIWEKTFDKGCDRMAISPDGLTMYLPSLEKNIWSVVDCKTGDVLTTIDGFTRSHNTLYGPSGNFVYLDDIGSPWLSIADTRKNSILKKIGPFQNNIRPFTINAKETMLYVTVDSLLGFETADLRQGGKLDHVAVEGWEKGPVRRHGNPSHGIGLTPDEKEIWLCDGHNMRLHIFNAVPPYQQLSTIVLQDMPGWITFSLDGRYAYPSSGEVIEVKTRKILTTLKDEFNNNVESEKMLELQFSGQQLMKTADQFGIGRKTGTN